MSPTGQAFWDEFHALQPDVDIVVLPPDDVPPDLPLGGPDDVDAAERVTRRTIAALLDESGLPDEALQPNAFFDRWQRRREDVHTHRTRVRIEHADAPAARQALLRVGDVLLAGGWEPAPVDSPTPWLVATAPTGARVDVAAEGAQLVLTATSAPLRLEDDAT